MELAGPLGHSDNHEIHQKHARKNIKLLVDLFVLFCSNELNELPVITVLVLNTGSKTYTFRFFFKKVVYEKAVLSYSES